MGDYNGSVGVRTKTSKVVMKHFEGTCMRIVLQYSSYETALGSNVFKHFANHNSSSRAVEVFKVVANKRRGDCPRCRLALMCLGEHSYNENQDQKRSMRASLQVLMCPACQTILAIT